MPADAVLLAVDNHHGLTVVAGLVGKAVFERQVIRVSTGFVVAKMRQLKIARPDTLPEDELSLFFVHPTNELVELHLCVGATTSTVEKGVLVSWVRGHLDLHVPLAVKRKLGVSANVDHQA